MKLAFRIGGPCLLALGLAGCGLDGTAENRNQPGYNPTGVGPFNSRGDYVEEWADSPDKWRKKPSKPPRVEPPRPTRDDDPPLIAANEQPPANSVPLPSSSSRPVANTPPPAPKPKPTAQVAAKPAPPKPKPKPAPVKTKPAPIRYTVKKGDTLYAIASRHKTTVTAVQRANGISGSLIQPGKVLVIPRY